MYGVNNINNNTVEMKKYLLYNPVIISLTISNEESLITQMRRRKKMASFQNKMRYNNTLFSNTVNSITDNTREINQEERGGLANIRIRITIICGHL